MENNNLISRQFEGHNVEIIEVNEEFLFELYSTGMALGQTKIAKGKVYPRKERIDKTVENAEISTVVHGGQQYLTEEMLYDFMLEARTDKCKKFRKWVTHEVLPSIRKAGCYIEETAEVEAVDYQKIYGTRRIRKTFTECKDFYEEYTNYKELTKAEVKASRVTSQDRIRQLKIISDTLTDFINENAVTVRVSKILEAREVLAEVAKDKTELHNRVNGGIKSHQTKTINKLTEELIETRKETDYEVDYYLIPNHPFSENYMYETVNTDFGLRTVKTKAYKNWIAKLDLSNLPEEFPIDGKAKIYLKYAVKEGFDNTNLNKSIQDQIANYYGINDKIFASIDSETITTVKEYYDGYIYVGFKKHID